MATESPTTDPLWAYNVPGWTSQGNTGDTIGANMAGPGGGSMLIEPAALSGYLGRTLDPDVTAANGSAGTVTFATGTAIMAAMQIMEPALTSKVVLVGKAVGTSTHAYAGLYNATSGQLVAQTADRLATGFGATSVATAISWTTPTVISSGYYWLLLFIVTGTTTTLVGLTLSSEAQSLLTGTAAVPFVLGSTPRFATGSTGLTSLAALPAALTTSMVIAPITGSSGFFAGLV
jgi:hypothetical protein